MHLRPGPCEHRLPTSLLKLFSISLLMESSGGLKSGVGVAEKRLFTRGLNVACAFQQPGFRVRSFSASIDVAIGIIPTIYKSIRQQKEARHHAVLAS